MVKSITSAGNLVKTVALSALLAGSVALGATNPVKTTKQTSIPNQTEVVSKDGAEAVKAMTLPQQPKPAVPTVHNKKLDEKCLKFCDNDEEKKEMLEFLSDIYSQQGSYLGTATIQQNLDVNMFLKFLNGDIEILKKFDKEAYNKIDRDAMKQVVEKSEPIKQWLNENYFKAYNEPFGQFDHPPDADEVNNALDDYVENDPNNLFGDMHVAASRYANNTFFEALKKCNMDIVQKNSIYIAYKINTADYLLFKNLLEIAGIYKGFDDRQVLNNFNKFMKAVEPKSE